ncbi:MAG: lipopolysaccharide kinase InaA family protein [Thermodesulfobacteriota bacterium]|nr:lipopolysaccharide kinase InaA family protein [Thermodesulfobacteriota bacterium]
MSSQYEDKKRYLIKKKLIKSLAGLTFKMHKAGFNHKDFYLCHILINMDDKGESFRLYIVDLHRANLNGRVKLYFRIKDLAALNYSAPKGIINRSDKLLFYKAYQGKGNYTLYDKFVIWCILKKSQKIFRHERKKIEV